MDEWQLITREYIDKYYPGFAERVAAEIQLADERARTSTNNGDFRSAYIVLRKEEEKRNRKKKKKQSRQRKYLEVYEKTHEVARLAELGFTKLEICKELDLKVNTVRHYLASARHHGLLPKRFVVKTTKNVPAAILENVEIKREFTNTDYGA